MGRREPARGRRCSTVIEEELAGALRRRGWRLAVADELTGGQLVDRLRDIGQDVLARRRDRPDDRRGDRQPGERGRATHAGRAPTAGPTGAPPASPDPRARAVAAAREAARAAGADVGLAVLGERRVWTRAARRRVWIGWYLTGRDQGSATVRSFRTGSLRLRQFAATAGLNELRLRVLHPSQRPEDRSRAPMNDVTET